MSAVINAGPRDSVDLPPADGPAQDSDVQHSPAQDIHVQGNAALPNHGRRRAERPPHARGSVVPKPVAVAGRAAVTILLIVAALVFLFLAVGPHFLNYQTSTMLTGSMSPGINPGDVVVSVKTPVSELKVGDVITYSIPIDDHRIETHRVASIKRDAGTTSVITKGDANPGADPWVAVLSEDYVYTQAGVVPHLGDAIRALRQPLVQSVLLYGASALLVVVVLTAIWKKPAEPGTEALPAESLDTATLPTESLVRDDAAEDATGAGSEKSRG
ncbi:signal peptidase I [Arthrobacter sp. ES3-54]|uniref:signal peptidase I n=1 Tax=Arthrobacter sp. ES3-54 TaxID=1502991 RepID=UPI00240708BA|nr:signal peptidase I [Arthrobacter sp. ES3-54]MDF9751649.1 signal peptidase [Arthrobacter sp. ES3-54]